ncbi:S9 family peptidase [Corynebacterium sp. CCUG 65737]|uniref:prolyl oligopeptidase family serine peptidase n=1 Tax=Corynebacterium sp. CCUG 65737 TaxID=2823889 RepID=UPI002108B16C|nr:prolyl oligopeptidase family serine peptidase [Corynebacterium sp. CCUG 65737]MCQ4626287.1 S9 family peptidase [Corynebacterium sp. CCUG 65737]
MTSNAPDLSIAPAELDEITGDKALAWASAWSAHTEQQNQDEELAGRIRDALDTDEKIPYVTRRGDYLYNFWRDREHPRGIWRRTTTDAYLRGTGEWEVVVDVDKLARDEGEDWVWKGAVVRPIANDRALIKLSRGGADAVTVREYHVDDRAFIDGFELPEAKTDVSWIDRDTLLVGTDIGKDSVTESGYPVEVRKWERGTAIEDAPVVFRGERSDVAVGAHVDHTPGFERVIFERALDFYTSRTYIDGELVDVPEDCIVVPHKQWLFLLPRTTFDGIPAGALAVASLDLTEKRVLIDDFPIEDLSVTATTLLVTVLDNVVTRIFRFELGTWDRSEVELPEAATASVVGTSPLDGDETWINVSSFTTPSTLLRDGEVVRQAPALFDASGLETRQHWAISADGTKVPYFITGDFSQGQRPCLVGGYGGFEVSLTPGYSAVRGISWLEKGYYFVQPNLRGGGEFGPEWHSQVVKTNRHKVWEDHRAVLEDVVARGYSAPEQLAIRGGSNGGLLTSGALVQYPGLFGAAVIQVPLTDMLRYHTLSAGASWMAEYGDPDVPEERAALESWSPLHNVADSPTYPPALVTTSTRDDRVHPAHARTFALALAKAGQPVDYFENTAGGHAGAADNEQVARVESLIYTWLENQIGNSSDQTSD